MKNDFENWKKEKLDEENKKLKEIKENENLEETIVIKNKIKLNGDRGYNIKGVVKKHKFSAGCQERGWFNGWHVGTLKGVEYGKDYIKLIRVVENYLNKCYDINRIEKEIK